MARVNRVTRTIVTTKASVLVFNEDTQAMETHVYEVPRAFEVGDKKLEKLIRAEVDGNADGHYVFVKIQKTEKQETLYGMLESDFIKYAEVLPPRAGEDTAE